MVKPEERMDGEGMMDEEEDEQIFHLSFQSPYFIIMNTELIFSPYYTSAKFSNEVEESFSAHVYMVKPCNILGRIALY